MKEFFYKHFNKIMYIIIVGGLLFALYNFYSCKPIDITDPPPTMNKITMYWNTESFQNTIELSILYKGTIHESYFRFQRENIDSKEPYIISIGTFNDTVNVSNGEITEIIYERQNIPYSTYRIYSEHAVKMHVQITVYQIH